MGKFILIIIGTVLVNNFVLARFLGICPFLGVSKKIETAIGMGMAVVFVITMAATITWLIFMYILVPFQITYMQTIAFILVIAALVQFVELLRPGCSSIDRSAILHILRNSCVRLWSICWICSGANPLCRNKGEIKPL